jgi:hypothetical protein
MALVVPRPSVELFPRAAQATPISIDPFVPLETPGRIVQPRGPQSAPMPLLAGQIQAPSPSSTNKATENSPVMPVLIGARSLTYPITMNIQTRKCQSAGKHQGLHKSARLRLKERLHSNPIAHPTICRSRAPINTNVYFATWGRHCWRGPQVTNKAFQKQQGPSMIRADAKRNPIQDPQRTESHIASEHEVWETRSQTTCEPEQ